MFIINCYLRKCLNMKALINLFAIILIVKAPEAFDLILEHLGFSHEEISYTPTPTLENSASAVNLGVNTFYKNEGFRDINIR